MHRQQPRGEENQRVNQTIAAMTAVEQAAMVAATMAI